MQKKLIQHKKYIYEFGDSYYCTSPHNPQLMKIFYNVCQENNIMYRTEDVFAYLREFTDKTRGNQLTLF